MSIQNQFTPAELARLIDGEVVSKVESATATDKTADKKPVEGALPSQTFTPTTSVPINSRVAVSRPNIRDQSGKQISPDEVVGVSKGIFDRIDEDQRAAKKALEAEVKASQEIKKVASPENLLNRLNAQHRLLAKMQKEIASLKKEIK